VPPSPLLFRRTDPRLGVFALRPVDPVHDARLLHGWVTHPKSRYWQMLHADLVEVRRQYEEIDGSPSHDAYVGLHDGRPAFLVERYDPGRDEVGRRYPVEPGDVGMHFLVAPTDRPRAGFTHAVLVTIMDWLFSDPAARRVVVEPDVRNEPVHARNAAVGFEVAGVVPLTGKQAYLSFCTREQYAGAAR
jgi:RimJ/RimL family protein N-acetyltransferase